MPLRTVAATLRYINDPDRITRGLLDVNPAVRMTPAEARNASLQKIWTSIHANAARPGARITGMAMLDADGKSRLVIELDSGYGLILPDRQRTP